jgi:hypothetical protein
VSKLSLNFKEILSRAHGNSKEHKDFDTSIIIINYCTNVNAVIIIKLINNIIIFLIKNYSRNLIRKKVTARPVTQ